MEMENLSQLQENPINIAISPIDADVLKSLNSQECIDFNKIIVQSVDSQTLVTNNECEITQNLIQTQDHNNFPNGKSIMIYLFFILFLKKRLNSNTCTRIGMAKLYVSICHFFKRNVK